MFENIQIHVQIVAKSFAGLQSLFDEKLVAHDLVSLFTEMKLNFSNFDSYLIHGPFDEALKCAKMLSIYGQQLGAKIQGFQDNEVKNAGKLLSIDCIALEDAITKRSTTAEHGAHDDRIKKLLNENEVRIVELEKKIKHIEVEAQQEINKILTTYTEGKEVIERLESEINEILGHVSGRAIAGDYEKSAADERAMADWLRYGALVCMGLIVLILGSAIVATITNEFEWPRFLSRVSLVFLLSVPAAYLARESAKHREQQYQHQQTSLDMKAVSPFLASLPEDEQHKVKAAIAARIFGGKDFSKVSSDPYPINTHEILLELIKKLEVPTKR